MKTAKQRGGDPLFFFVFLSAWALLHAVAASAEPAFQASFRRIPLSDVFFCEGATFGDLNRDKKMDLVAGPYLYLGPDFKRRFEYYKPEPFDKGGYSKNFFAFVHDFNADGWSDIFIIGFPGEDASWYENPKGKAGLWRRHRVFDVVDNESPTFGDLTGDGKPELICSTGGRLGWAEPDWRDAAKPWTFHPISPEGGPYQKYTHGLGTGDVNGDGRMDFLEAGGWWEQPGDLSKGELWRKHDVSFGRGGAQMYAVDIDGDGDNDVVTSLEAHGWGLAWFEHVKEGDRVAFREHLIMGDTPDKNKHGVKFSQPHAVACVDMDGDGITDIVTGKRHWAHGPKGDPEPDAPAVLYWFRTVRGPEGVDFVPVRIDDASGVGVQVVAGDINGDKLGDVVIGNKLGTFVFLQVPGKGKAGPAKGRKSEPALFNGKDLSGWEGSTAVWKVENGEIVGKTEGLTRNEFLRSRLDVGDFRLILQVKLAGDQGNSGIQFRSAAVGDGDVKGYQADIGPGWWGKLYEEHGRALIWDRSGEEHVKKGEWNTYEVLAVGGKIRTAINGMVCVDLDDPAGAKRGILAFQVHSGGPTEVRFRDIQLELNPAFEMKTAK